MTKNIHSERVVIQEGKYIRFWRQGTWEFVERSNCTAIVVILAMTKERKVILTEQYRIPVQSNVIEFPAGLVNDLGAKKKESILTAAKRELWEETGYRAKRMQKVLEGPVSGGFTVDKLTIVRALDIKKVGAGGGDETENIKVHEVPLDKVPQWLRKMEKAGCLVDPKVYAGLFFLNQNE